MVDKAEDDKTPGVDERERNMDSRINPNPKQEVCGMLRWTIFQPVASDPLYGDALRCLLAHTHTHTHTNSKWVSEADLQYSDLSSHDNHHKIPSQL